MNKIKKLLKEKIILDKKKEFLDKRKFINKNLFLGFENIHKKIFTKKESELFTEKTSYAPSSPYSATKASSDHLV